MSAISSVPPSAASTSTLSGALPLVNPADEPEIVRNGNPAAKNAYDTGVAFEDVLVTQLVQQMTATVPGLSDGSGDSSGDSSDSSSDGSSDSSGGLGAYSSLMPNTLASSIMGSGGTGVAMQIARSIDPALLGGKS